MIIHTSAVIAILRDEPDASVYAQAIDADWPRLCATSTGAVPLRRAWRSPLWRGRITAMIIDTSAVIAILRDEPDAAVYAQAIERALHRRISAATFIEAAAVIDGS